ncbi:transmembrane channel-like protein 3 isoform X1 [Pieris brassicae]|uniref:transmembrane channel-like protein 3 isoform X1 n=1 Tax=Pieris brassicae TaxID=7116 RepID=UPI001E660D2C|nr:transmembrane channel-like protein 3 isoform X1 [Pieris brassicae]XP_045521073.1 transmembrane channel-like protein 3 isoform X1 [Pieris brassicae]
MEDQVEDIELRPATLRRNLTIKNNVARQVAINFMPSRQAPYNTLRLRRVNSENNALLDAVASDTPDAANKQADIIVREMELHTHLMQNDPVSEELRREALRDLPQGLTMKRNVRAKLSASVSLHSKRRPISVLKRFQYRLSFAWKRTRERFRDLIFSIQLWYEPIRIIEGHLGTAVGSYFHLLRWLFSLNLLLSGLVVCFLVVPQVLHDHNNSTTTDLGWLDIISGKGGLEDSLLFYGHYHDGVINGSLPLSYNMPFAYFFTMFCIYVGFFLVFCYRTAYSYRRNFIETSGGLSNVFANKVFCGWDFGIVSAHAASLNAASLFNEFKELLSEKYKVKVKRSLCMKIFEYTVNTIVWVTVLGSMVALHYGVWALRAMTTRTTNWNLLVSLILTSVLAVCPLLFNFLVRLEFYRPRTSFYVTLARTWLLDITTLSLIFYYWAKSSTKCWETVLGQEAYRLVLLDSVVSLLLLPAVEFVRILIFKLNPKGTGPEFNIAYNSLTLIYNQALLWLGLLFSPLLAVAVTIKFFLLFYIKRVSVLRACRPARKVWRAAQTQTVLYMFVTLSLFTTLFGIGVLFLASTSDACGPFRQYVPVIAVIGEGVLGLSTHQTLNAIITFIIRPGVIGFLFVALCVSVYYMRAKSIAQRSMVDLLRQMLVLQAKDKDFLLTAIAKVSNGEWLYSPKPEENADSHTWRYLHEVRKPSNAGYHFDGSRLSHAFDRSDKPVRPRSERPQSVRTDGDTDSSFSWQGSSNYLNDLENRRMI